MVDPNAFHSRDVSALRLDDGRVSGGSYRQFQLVIWFRMLPRQVVGHDHESGAHLYILYASSTAHPRFHTIPLTEMQYTHCNIFGNVTITFKPKSVQSPVKANRSTLTTPPQRDLPGVRRFATLPRTLCTGDIHWHGASLRTIEYFLPIRNVFSNYLVLT